MKNKLRPPVILLNMAVNTFNQKEMGFLYSIYALPVSNAGAVPFCIPAIEKEENIETLLDIADGVLLIGGQDYDPAYYGQQPHPETDLSRQRPHFDIALGEAVLRRKLPVVGICGGCQLLNIVSGGELIQHLPNADECHRGGLFHQAQIVSDGFLTRALDKKKGNMITVNSFHHQALNRSKIGRDLTISALAFDGTVEAVESADPARMILGLQFHPERMEDSMSGIFKLLKDEAERYRKCFK